MNNKVIVILGPTSSGKSDIAIKLAKKFNGEIISADSRQIYRGMDIGTGKVSCDKRFGFGKSRQFRCWKEKAEPWVSQGIPHYMISIVSPRTNYNVTKFKYQAEKIIADILRHGKLPIICGGTGFWIQALVDNLNFPEVKPDWKFRNKLKKYSTEKLFSMLKKLDPRRAKNIDRNNRVRLIRAIEICKKIKRVPLLKNSQFLPTNSQLKFLQIGIKLPKEKLHKKIEKRVLARFAQGMIEEVEKLHQQGFSWKKIQSFGLAYYWIPLYLQKKISKTKLIEKIIRAEKNYAKRQMTWFKRDKRIHWLENYQEIEKQVRKFMNEKSGNKK